ncbi:uncharacterized protein Obp99d [Drosophila pseudoobscura]|uniref:Uncharacterized protein Obp99d n=1 Tax=Drosophila pseudoobscura pseudoobscura TaxID=46245 RepID=A0A6I8UMH2_DROPS|nr:uncharacterized protein LOC4800501 [Drosophila pseudoobscura]
MRPLKFEIFCWSCLLLLAVPSTRAASDWQLPSPEQVYKDLDSCRLQSLSDGQDAETLRCLVEKLGLWSDESGYNSKRIAKIFAGHNQMEELQLVVGYCNRREQRLNQPNEWAYQAYKCATSGRFGHWVKDYMKQKKKDK